MKTITIDLMKDRIVIPVPQSSEWLASELCVRFLRKSFGLLMAGHSDHLHADAWLSITSHIIGGKFASAAAELQAIELDSTDIDLYNAASGGLAGLWLENVLWAMSSVAHEYEGNRRAQIILRRPSMMERIAYAAILKAAGFDEVDIRILVEGQNRAVVIEGSFVRELRQFTTVPVMIDGNEVIIDGVRSLISILPDGEIALRHVEPAWSMPSVEAASTQG